MNIGFNGLKPCPFCIKGKMRYDGKTWQCLNCSRELPNKIPDFILKEFEHRIGKGRVVKGK